MLMDSLSIECTVVVLSAQWSKRVQGFISGLCLNKLCKEIQYFLPVCTAQVNIYIVKLSDVANCEMPLFLRLWTKL